MCTAATYRTKDHYFGRTMDINFSVDQCLAITPRNYPFHFHRVHSLTDHYALIGMAHVEDGYPLYFDATNEKGLSIAGLNFPDNARYHPDVPGLDNVTPNELIPWIMGQCATVDDAKWLLDRMNLLNMPFSESLPLAPLHWIIADAECSIVVESVEEGLRVYDNPVGILTNNPPFQFHQLHLSSYMNLTSQPPTNRFSPSVDLTPYSFGFGAIGLPGDVSSTSRFVRAAFNRLNSVSGDSEAESVSQLMHILSSVTQIRGCALTSHGYETTFYTSCCNAAKGIYYYTTYNNSQLSAVDMHRENLNSSQLICYPMLQTQQVHWQN